VVVARLDRATQYSRGRRFRFDPRSRGVLDHPHARVMTTEFVVPATAVPL
jgi:hypothetical protein